MSQIHPNITKFITDKLTDKKVLISGGTGFIGRNILKYLYKNSIPLANVTVITRCKGRFLKNNPEFVKLSNLDYLETDICDLKYTHKQYDYVIHGATSAIDKTEAKQLFHEAIEGIKKILEFAVNAGATSVINLSSGAVYGSLTQCVPVHESLLTIPVIESKSSSYGLGKRVSEHYSYLYANDLMKVTSLRGFCFGGEYLDMEYYVLGNFIKQATNNENIIVQAGKGIYRSYLAIEDLVEAILYTMIKANDREANYEVYNVGSDEAIAIPELAHTVCQILNSQSKVVCPNLNDEQNIYYVPNVDKIRNTGLKMSSKLEDIILNVQKYYLSQMSLQA
jgi:nucleoside-diphosphate-sugar epimerase